MKKYILRYNYTNLNNNVSYLNYNIKCHHINNYTYNLGIIYIFENKHNKKNLRHTTIKIIHYTTLLIPTLLLLITLYFLTKIRLYKTVHSATM